jgi:hypothetical protein
MGTSGEEHGSVVITANWSGERWTYRYLCVSPTSPPLLSRLSPRRGVDPPAPLSLSSSGSAGRSDWERGGRPLCTGSSLGCSPVSGGLPCWSFSPSSSGSDGRRPSSSPSLHPSSPNKPARSRPQVGDRVPPLQARRGDDFAGFWLDPRSGYLDLWWRASQQSPLPLSAGCGGRNRRKNLLLAFLCAVASLCLIPRWPAVAVGGSG